MNISIRQLQTFVSIGRLGSFTKAAHALHATQPALSAQVRELEETLGVRLFDRNTRSVALTTVGRDLLPQVDQVLRDLGAVAARARDVADRATGRVTIAALPSISSSVLPMAIAQFRATYPGITVALKDALADRISDLVHGGEVDFGVGGASGQDAQVLFTQLAADRMMAVMPRDHPLAKPRTLRLSALIDQPLILMDRDSSVRRIVDATFAALGRMASPAYEAAFMATAVGMVRAGLGITLLPSSAVEVRSASDLAVRPLDHPGLKRPLGIVMLRGRSLSPAAETFVAALRVHAKTWFKPVRARPRG